MLAACCPFLGPVLGFSAMLPCLSFSLVCSCTYCVEGSQSHFRFLSDSSCPQSSFCHFVLPSQPFPSFYMVVFCKQFCTTLVASLLLVQSKFHSGCSCCFRVVPMFA